MSTLLLLIGLAAAEPKDIEQTSSSDDYTQGYYQGQQDAGMRVDGVRPALLGAGAGVLGAGVGVTCCGVVGAPLVLGGVAGPTVYSFRNPPVPPAGAWEEESADYRTGYIQGYQETGRRRQVRYTAAGATVGAVVGVGTGVAVLFAVQSQLD